MTETDSQNSHLAVVFREMLPAIHNAGFRYWVYGGVGIAGIVGRFLRRNEDVDVYVLNSDFASVRSVLETCCSSKVDWELQDVDLVPGRPKINIRVRGNELLSVVPVFEVERGVEHVFNVRLLLPSPAAVTQEHKRVGAYTFFSPPVSIVLTIFQSLLTERPNLLRAGKRRIDALAVLSAAEIDALASRDTST